MADMENVLGVCIISTSERDLNHVSSISEFMAFISSFFMFIEILRR